jgi:hypothetical protein
MTCESFVNCMFTASSIYRKAFRYSIDKTLHRSAATPSPLKVTSEHVQKLVGIHVPQLAWSFLKEMAFIIVVSLMMRGHAAISVVSLHNENKDDALVLINERPRKPARQYTCPLNGRAVYSLPLHAHNSMRHLVGIDHRPRALAIMRADSEAAVLAEVVTVWGVV